MFISHDGRISPSGFLPLVASDVRRDDPVEVYRMAPVFRDLRDTAKLQGKCGICEYRSVCGGGCARPERWAARRRRAAPRGGGLAGHRAARSFLGRHAPGVGAHHPVVGDLGARHSPAIAPAQPRRAFGEAVQQLRLPEMCGGGLTSRVLACGLAMHEGDPSCHLTEAEIAGVAA